MSDLQEKKFGYVIEQPCIHHHYPLPPPPPRPIPPGMTVQDWINYINTYIDVRARQIYDRLKNKGQISEDGIKSVKFIPENGMDDENQFLIGKLNVDGEKTPIRVPNPTSGGIQDVRYIPEEGMEDQFIVGNLSVDGEETPVRVPVVELAAETEFKNPKLILQVSSAGIEGVNSDGKVPIYCEDPKGFVFDEILVKDSNPQSSKVYKIYIQNGQLKSEETQVQQTEG